MAVGRISGPLLKANLVRNGIDLAFETDLLYLDVNNQRIGVKTTSPQHELDVNGTTRTTNLQVLNQAEISDITISGTTISTEQSYLNLGTLDTVVYQNRARIDSIDIEGNTISTNISNANLEFRPNGTGSTEISSDMNVTGNIRTTGNLDVMGNVTIGGNITIGDENTDILNIVAGVNSNLIPNTTSTYNLGSVTNNWSTLYAAEANIDEIEINTNYIRTTTSNSDLELIANGSGRIYVPNNDVQIDNSLTVSGLTTLANTNITGTVTYIGDYDQTGDTNIVGSVLISQDLDVGSSAQFENIRIDGNVITSTLSNSDLELKANGTGNIVIPYNDVLINNDLTVQGTITAQNIVVSGTLTADRFTTGDILIDDNYITTTQSNSDLELRTNGSGVVVIDNINVFDYTISTADNMVLSPGSEILIIDATGSMKLPAGNTAQRPTGVAGQIRFNNQLNRFEGFDGTDWIQLHGVVDLDGDTKVTAELTQGANDNIIRFDIAGSTIIDVDSNRLNAPRITVDDIEIDGNVIRNVTTDSNLVLGAQGSGSVVIDNLAFKENTITNIVGDSITEFINIDNGYVKFSGNNGFVLPVGDSTNRPISSFREVGMIRFNTADSRVEVFNGTTWTSVVNIAETTYLAIETVLVLG